MKPITHIVSASAECSAALASSCCSLVGTDPVEAHQGAHAAAAAVQGQHVAVLTCSAVQVVDPERRSTARLPPPHHRRTGLTGEQRAVPQRLEDVGADRLDHRRWHRRADRWGERDGQPLADRVRVGGDVARAAPGGLRGLPGHHPGAGPGGSALQRGCGAGGDRGVREIPRAVEDGVHGQPRRSRGGLPAGRPRARAGDVRPAAGPGGDRQRGGLEISTAEDFKVYGQTEDFLDEAQAEIRS